MIGYPEHFQGIRAELLGKRTMPGRRAAALATLILAGCSVSSDAAPRVGDVFRDNLSSGGTGPEMVVIPAGRFRMGCVSGRDCAGIEEPVRDVVLAYPLAVSKYEVTFAQWDACVAAGGCGGYRPDDESWGRGERPVINVSWEEAQSFVQWLSRQTGTTYRLLSESEWEYAARAGTSTAYSCGAEIGSGRANCDGCGSRWDNSRTAPAGSFAANGWGLHDMHGNAFEWVEDCWNPSYDGAPADGEAWRQGDCSVRVMRGGSWIDLPWGVRSAIRHRRAADDRDNRRGLRVARTLAD